MRALETLDLMDCGETVFIAALERKETGDLHRRSYFPFTNPPLSDKFLTFEKAKAGFEPSWRDNSLLF